MQGSASEQGAPLDQVVDMVRRRRRWIVAAALGLVLLWFMWSAKHLGVNVDQLFDQQSFLNMLARGTGSERWGVYPLSPAYQATEESYGYTFHALAFFVSWLISPIMGRSFEPLSMAAFTDKNVLVVVVAAVGVWALYRMVLSLSGRVLAAGSAAVALVLIPAFSGHALMNQKDIPLAVGVTCLTAGCVCFINWVRAGGDPSGLRARNGPEWTVGLLLGVGIALGVGSRPQVAVTAGVAMAFAAGVGWWFRAHRRQRLWVASAIGVALGSLLVLITNPASLPNPVGWVLNSIEVARDFPSWSGQVLVRGTMYAPGDQPWWYLPFVVMVQTPFAIIAAVALGVVATVSRAMASANRLSAATPWVPVGLQLFPAVVGVIGGSLFYNAGRQVLFVLPVIAVFAGLGFAWLWDRVRPWRYRSAVAVVLVVLVALPVVDTLRLFPYQYVYFNEFERGSDLIERYEFDYWGISSREAMDWINETSPDAVVESPGYWMYPPFGGPGVAMLDGEWLSRLDSWRVLNADREVLAPWDVEAGRDTLWAGNYYPSWGMDPRRDCPVVHEVTRPLWDREILLSFVRRCPPGGG